MSLRLLSLQASSPTCPPKISLFESLSGDASHSNSVFYGSISIGIKEKSEEKNENEQEFVRDKIR